jgi:uncharacterized protein (TIGR02147 family)
LAQLQTKNPGFSLRSFARRLQITPAELSLILNGKRRVTQKMAAKLVDRLALPPAQAERLMAALPARLPRRKSAVPSVLKSIQLSSDEFNVIADWYHLAVLSLAETDGFEGRPEWIAQRLGIRLREAQSAVQTLLRLGMLEEGAQGLRATGKEFRTSTDVPDASVRKNHAQGLELARAALDEVPIELRDFGASIIAADPDLLPAAKQRLRELRREMVELLESGKKKEVYRLSVQLIPLSRGKVGEVK